MKNLAQFKRRLAVAQAIGGTVDFHFKEVTLYGVDHPARLRHPEGQVYEAFVKGRKIGRVQSQAFTCITEKGTESWLYFGAAAEWTFPDVNTAVCMGGSYKGNEYECIKTLTYKFNPLPEGGKVLLILLSPQTEHNSEDYDRTLAIF